MTEAGNKRAVILVSGGLDSTTVLAMARDQGFACYTLSFDYGQRHRAELSAAARVSQSLGDVEHKIVKLNLDSIGGSALTDTSIAVPEEETQGIPITYVPARNTVFLSIALGWVLVYLKEVTIPYVVSLFLMFLFSPLADATERGLFACCKCCRCCDPETEDDRVLHV